MKNPAQVGRLLLAVILTIAVASSTPPVIAAPGGNLAAFTPRIYSNYYTGIFPADYYRWAETGPGGGTVTSVVIDPQNSNNVYAASFDNGVFTSTDGGFTWKAYNTGLVTLVIQSLAIDPVTPSTIYAGTYGYGVYKSTDSGKTWAATGPGLNPNPVVYGLAVHPSQPNILFAGTRSKLSTMLNGIEAWGGGIYKSTDGGASWRAVNGGMPDDWVYGVAIDPINPNNVIIATHFRGTFKSDNTGEYWVSAGGQTIPPEVRSVAYNPQNPKIIYAGTWDLNRPLMKSIDGGDSWQLANNGMGATKILKVAVDPTNPEIAYACNVGAGNYPGGVFRTTDGGANWYLIGPSSRTAYAAAVDPHQSNKVYVGVENDGVFESNNNGSTWFDGNRGLNAATVVSVAPDPTAPERLYVSTYNRGIYRSQDSGSTWQPAGSGIVANAILKLAVDPLDPQIIYAGTDNNGIWKSYDRGNSWAAINYGAFSVPPAPSAPVSPDDTGLTLLADRLEKFRSNGINLASVSVDAFLINPTNSQILYAGAGSGVYKTSNGGGVWGASGLPTNEVYDLEFSPGSTTTIYAATNQGIFRSDDSAGWWNQIALGGQKIAALALAPTNPVTIYASIAGQGVLRSEDAGVTWTPINDGLLSQTVNAFVIDPQSPTVVYAGTNQGIYRSGNRGDFWVRFDIDLNGQSVVALTLRPTTPISLYGGLKLERNLYPPAHGTSAFYRSVCPHDPAIGPGCRVGLSPRLLAPGESG